jgi:hypothetical protein
MPSLWPKMNHVLVPAGVMDDDVDITPHAHIYIADKAPWFDLTDALPQFDELLPQR